MNLESAPCSARPGAVGLHWAHQGWPSSPLRFALSSLVERPCSGRLFWVFLKKERPSLPDQTLVCCPAYCSCLQGPSVTWVPAAAPDQPCSHCVLVLSGTELIFAVARKGHGWGLEVILYHLTPSPGAGGRSLFWLSKRGRWSAGVVLVPSRGEQLGSAGSEPERVFGWHWFQAGGSGQGSVAVLTSGYAVSIWHVNHALSSVHFCY